MTPQLYGILYWPHGISTDHQNLTYGFRRIRDQYVCPTGESIANQAAHRRSPPLNDIDQKEKAEVEAEKSTGD